MAVKKRTAEKSAAVKNEIVVMPPEGAVRFLSYAVSFFVPVSGFVLGAVFYSQAGSKNKEFGKKCFIFMTAGIALALLFVILSIAAGLLAGSLGGVEGGFKESYY
ncbi:MAG: hypothetical protein ACLFP1_08730 [Candidatus Goldiibacteriota bacterium]